MTVVYCKKRIEYDLINANTNKTSKTGKREIDKERKTRKRKKKETEAVQGEEGAADTAEEPSKRTRERLADGCEPESEAESAGDPGREWNAEPIIGPAAPKGKSICRLGPDVNAGVVQTGKMRYREGENRNCLLIDRNEQEVGRFDTKRDRARWKNPVPRN